MISKEEFKKLVEIVMVKTGLSREKLAERLGYGHNYISEVTSPSGKLTDKFVSAFKKEYMENPNAENPYLKIIETLTESNRIHAEANERLLRINEKLMAYLVSSGLHDGSPAIAEDEKVNKRHGFELLSSGDKKGKSSGQKRGRQEGSAVKKRK